MDSQTGDLFRAIGKAAPLSRRASNALAVAPVGVKEERRTITLGDQTNRTHSGYQCWRVQSTSTSSLFIIMASLASFVSVFVSIRSIGRSMVTRTFDMIVLRGMDSLQANPSSSSLPHPFLLSFPPRRTVLSSYIPRHLCLISVSSVIRTVAKDQIKIVS